MATITSTINPLPHYFVDIGYMRIEHSSSTVEINHEAKSTQVEQMMLYADDKKEHYFIGFRYLGEELWKVGTGFHVRHRPKNPSTYKITDKWAPENAIVGTIARDTWRYILLVDTKAWGETGLFWLCLDPDLRAGVWVGYDEPLQTGNFEIESRFADFLEALREPDSDIRFVLYWIRLSLEAKLRLSTFYTNGDEEDLRQVVRAITFHESPPQEPSVLVYINGFLIRDWRPRYFKIGGPPPPFRLPYPAPNLRLEMWGKHVRNYFGIHGDSQLMRQYPWLKPIQPEIMVDYSHISLHEKLEATRFLSEWAKHKIPPLELESLLLDHRH